MTVTDTLLLDEMETYEISVEFTGTDVLPWRARYGFDAREDTWLYQRGETAREALQRAIEACHERAAGSSAR